MSHYKDPYKPTSIMFFFFVAHLTFPFPIFSTLGLQPSVWSASPIQNCDRRKFWRKIRSRWGGRFLGRNSYRTKRVCGKRFDPRSRWNSSPSVGCFPKKRGWWNTAFLYTFYSFFIYSYCTDWLLEVPSSVFLLLSGACVFFLCFCLCVGSQFLLVCFLALWFWMVYMYMKTWVNEKRHVCMHTNYMIYDSWQSIWNA